MAFSSSLHVIRKGNVLNRNTALSTELMRNSCNSAFLSAPPAVREWIYRDSYSHSACGQFLSGQKLTEFACPAVNIDRLMKNKLMWILHNSDKLSRIISGADTIHIIIY